MSSSEEFVPQGELDPIPEDGVPITRASSINGLRWLHLMRQRSQGGSVSTRGALSDSIPSDIAEVPDANRRAPANEPASRRLSCVRTKRMWLLVALVAVAIVAGVAVGIVFLVNDSGGNDSQSPPNDEIMAGPQEKAALESLFMSISGDALLNASSPQSMAQTWILQVDGEKVSISAQGEERVLQRYVLCVCYYALGANWTTDTFLSPSDECGWTGVTCNESELVVALNWSELGLKGTIPPEMSELILLEQVAMPRNTITGSVPVQLWNLGFLSSIDFSDNQLTGTLPSFVWELPFLEYLYLNSNSMSGTLPEIPASAPPLRDVWLQANAMIGSLPSSIGNLVTLGTSIMPCGCRVFCVSLTACSCLVRNVCNLWQ